MFNPINLIPAPIRMYALAGALAASFSAGLYVRGYVCTADINSAIVDAVKETQDKMEKDYEQAKKVEGYKAEQRRKARQNRAKLSQDFDNHLDYSKCIVPDSGVRLRNEAIGN